jgi:hypothetical protein
MHFSNVALAFHFFGAPTGVRKNALTEAAADTCAHQQNGCGAPTDVMNRWLGSRYGSESSGCQQSTKQAQRHRFILPARVAYKRDGQHDRANGSRQVYEEYRVPSYVVD